MPPSKITKALLSPRDFIWKICQNTNIYIFFYLGFHKRHSGKLKVRHISLNRLNNFLREKHQYKQKFLTFFNAVCRKCSPWYDCCPGAGFPYIQCLVFALPLHSADPPPPPPFPLGSPGQEQLNQSALFNRLVVAALRRQTDLDLLWVCASTRTLCSSRDSQAVSLLQLLWGFFSVPGLFSAFFIYFFYFGVFFAFGLKVLPSFNKLLLT